jgi:hypothetical protein
MWVYRYRGFCCRVSGKKMECYSGWWAFCVYCHALFADRAFEALAARVCSLNPPIPHADAARVYRIVGEVVYGDPVLWKEGEDWSPKRFPCPPPSEVEVKV